MHSEPLLPPSPPDPGPGAGPSLWSGACPRCGAHTEQEHYGPCEACRGELRATMCVTPKASGDEAYEPKMNVTPNAVALKEE